MRKFVAGNDGVVMHCGDGRVVPAYGVDEGVATGIVHESRGRHSRGWCCCQGHTRCNCRYCYCEL